MSTQAFVDDLNKLVRRHGLRLDDYLNVTEQDHKQPRRGHDDDPCIFCGGDHGTGLFPDSEIRVGRYILDEDGDIVWSNFDIIDVQGASIPDVKLLTEGACAV
jgi:hypothetical protein